MEDQVHSRCILIIEKREGTLVSFASHLLSKLSAQRPSSGTSLFVQPICCNVLLIIAKYFLPLYLDVRFLSKNEEGSEPVFETFDL